MVNKVTGSFHGKIRLPVIFIKWIGVVRFISNRIQRRNSYRNSWYIPISTLKHCYILLEFWYPQLFICFYLPAFQELFNLPEHNRTLKRSIYRYIRSWNKLIFRYKQTNVNVRVPLRISYIPYLTAYQLGLLHNYECPGAIKSLLWRLQPIYRLKDLIETVISRKRCLISISIQSGK